MPHKELSLSLDRRLQKKSYLRSDVTVIGESTFRNWDELKEIEISFPLRRRKRALSFLLEEEFTDTGKVRQKKGIVSIISMGFHLYGRQQPSKDCRLKVGIGYFVKLFLPFCLSGVYNIFRSD